MEAFTCIPEFSGVYCRVLQSPSCGENESLNDYCCELFLMDLDCVHRI